MISFSRLGIQGRLGNQLFQYAFLRTTAKRLETAFFCPRWIGDEIFELRDENERAREPLGITNRYREPSYFGYNTCAQEIPDNTDISGFFQTDRYFDKADVRAWYRFKEGVTRQVEERYRQIDFSSGVAIGLRFGDKRVGNAALKYYNPNLRYYDRGLELLRARGNVLVFSDEPQVARAYLKGLKADCLFIEGNSAWEDLFLMSRCRHAICSTSTLHWWGAFLNPSPDRIVIAPREGPTRPGHWLRNEEFFPRDFIRLKALRWPYNSFRILDALSRLFKRPIA